MPTLHHALLGVSVLALAAAGTRAASPLAERGLARAIAATVLATAAAVGEAIVLGLAGLGGSTAALTLAALAAAGVALALLPRPAVPLSDELAGWWRARGLAGRVGAGALAGAGAAWVVWQLRHPAIGFDALHYHAPEMVLFVQGGRPGSVLDVLTGLPVGNYPLTTEVTIAWAMGIARSFVPLMLWPWIALTLTAASAVAGLRALGVGRLATALGAAALCTSPWLLAWQSNGSVTDPPALAFLTACGALCALSRERPALLAPAVVAAGLAVGCKTTVLPLAAVALALGFLAAGRERPRALPWRTIALAAALATLVGGVWYLRNLIEHGSPFWPIVGTPWGDPVPPSVELVSTSFLDRPRATIDVIGDAYLRRFGGGLLLLGAGVLAPVVAPRRRVVLAAAAVLGGLLLWANSPITGLSAGPQTLPETVFSTTRYLLPVLASACVALALAARDGGRFRAAALVALAAAAGVNVVQTFRLEYPIAPAATTPLAGALAGGIAAALLGRLRPRGALDAARRRAAALAGALAVGLALAIPAAGFVARHGDSAPGEPGVAVRRLVADPAFRSGSAPVATAPAFIAPLAGDRLRHPLEAIGPGEGCPDMVRRARSQWIVLYGGLLGRIAPQALRRCLPPPTYRGPGIAAYRPPSVR